MTKLEIAKLLANTPGVMASKEEIIQFFHSPQFIFEEEEEGNIIEDFMVFRGILDKDILDCKDWNIDKTFLKGKTTDLPKIPKKVQQQLDKERQELQDYIKSFDE